MSDLQMGPGLGDDLTMPDGYSVLYDKAQTSVEHNKI